MPAHSRNTLDPTAFVILLLVHTVQYGDSQLPLDAPVVDLV